MIYSEEGFEEEQMSNLGCESVSDLIAELKRLREGIRSILSDYDITELIRDVPEEEWNFEQQALVRMKEMIESGGEEE